MDLHSITEYKTIDLDAFEQQALYEKRGLIPQIAPRYRAPYFAHIFNGGYAAGYYGYLWAEVLDKDAFQVFTKSGDLFDREVAQAFRSTILEPGGSSDGIDAVQKLYGTRATSIGHDGGPEDWPSPLRKTARRLSEASASFPTQSKPTPRKSRCLNLHELNASGTTSQVRIRPYELFTAPEDRSAPCRASKAFGQVPNGIRQVLRTSGLPDDTGSGRRPDCSRQRCQRPGRQRDFRFAGPMHRKSSDLLAESGAGVSTHRVETASLSDANKSDLKVVIHR